VAGFSVGIVLVIAAVAFVKFGASF